MNLVIVHPTAIYCRQYKRQVEIDNTVECAEAHATRVPRAWCNFMRTFSVYEDLLLLTSTSTLLLLLLLFPSF